ncbi:DUF3224 family protein [Erwinia sp. CPCC 100877]|nr:DUF3224 family protein [Erwinia sp. CPCC 100877]
MQASFNVTKWEEQPINESRLAFPVTQVHAEYELEGDLIGKAWVEYLLYYLENTMEDRHLATARITGFLHFEGQYKGKTGTFTAAEKGIFAKGLLDSPGMLIKAGGQLETLTGSYQYDFMEEQSTLLLDFKD